MENGKKRVAILVEDKYEELELWYPKLRLREAGIKVDIVGPERDVYYSKNHYPVQADREIGEVSIRDYDGVVIPGGFAPDYMRRSREMIHFVRMAEAEGRLIAAICHAGWLLISAAVVENRRLTGFHSIKADLENAGAIFEDQPVVEDVNLITSRTPDDLPEFCTRIISYLKQHEAPLAPQMEGEKSYDKNSSAQD